MKLGKAVNSAMGIIAIVLAALILVDGILGLMGQDTVLFSLDAFKLVVGFIALLLAGTLLDTD